MKEKFKIIPILNKNKEQEQGHFNCFNFWLAFRITNMACSWFLKASALIVIVFALLRHYYSASIIISAEFGNASRKPVKFGQTPGLGNTPARQPNNLTHVTTAVVITGDNQGIFWSPEVDTLYNDTERQCITEYTLKDFFKVKNAVRVETVRTRLQFMAFNAVIGLEFKQRIR